MWILFLRYTRLVMRRRQPGHKRRLMRYEPFHLCHFTSSMEALVDISDQAGSALIFFHRTLEFDNGVDQGRLRGFQRCTIIKLVISKSRAMNALHHPGSAKAMVMGLAGLCGSGSQVSSDVAICEASGAFPFATQHQAPRMPANDCLTMPHLTALEISKVY